MKHQTVYVPEINETIVDFDGSESITSCMEIVNHTSLYIGVENNFILKKWNDLVSAHILQKFENVNILTDSELIELKKKWMEEAMDEGAFIQQEGKNEDREQFLNNLKLD